MTYSKANPLPIGKIFFDAKLAASADGSPEWLRELEELVRGAVPAHQLAQVEALRVGQVVEPGGRGGARVGRAEGDGAARLGPELVDLHVVALHERDVLRRRVEL